MYIKPFNECFGCTKSVLFPLNVPAPPLSMAEFREYNHVQLLKITPFIHWEMGFSRYSQYNMEGKETLQCFRSLWFSTQNHLHILRWPVMYHTLTDILHWNISLLTNSYPDYISSTFCCCMYMNVKRIKFGWSIVF